MPIKIENRSSLKLPDKTEEIIQSVMDIVPRDHTIGLSKIMLVDQVAPDSRLPIDNISELPGLYHPKQGGLPAWVEVAIGVILPKEGFFKRLAARLNFKPNLAYLILSLQAQHYLVNSSHSVKLGGKKARMEETNSGMQQRVRSYTDQYHKLWREKRSGWRGRLFKPIQPYFDKWARNLRKKYDSEQRRKSA